jgi:hypothetical protein
LDFPFVGACVDVRNLLREADLAMYRAEANGSGNEVFDPLPEDVRSDSERSKKTAKASLVWSI